MEQGAGGVPEASSGWLRRPFARTFDLLSSEYGWTDSQILDLTLQRMRQCREVALERIDEERRRELRVREMEVRHLASMVAGAAGWKQGVSAARRIQLFERRKEDMALPSTERVVRLLGGSS